MEDLGGKRVQGKERKAKMNIFFCFFCFFCFFFLFLLLFRFLFFYLFLSCFLVSCPRSCFPFVILSTLRVCQQSGAVVVVGMHTLLFRKLSSPVPLLHRNTGAFPLTTYFHSIPFRFVSFRFIIFRLFSSSSSAKQASHHPNACHAAVRLPSLTLL